MTYEKWLENIKDVFPEDLTEEENNELYEEYLAYL